MATYIISRSSRERKKGVVFMPRAGKLLASIVGWLLVMAAQAESNSVAASVSARLNRWSLRGYTALVTGGSRGIGRGIAEELAMLGASVYICARTQRDIDGSLQTWREAGLSVEGSVCDIAARENRTQLIEKVSQQFHGKLDILVNNAGTSLPYKSLAHVTEEEYAFLMSTNLESSFHLCQLAHPLLKASTQGSVVFVSSIAGVTSVVGIATAVYSMTKAAMDHLTKTLADEWSKDAIRVNCVAPGFVWTDLTDPMLRNPELKSKVQKLVLLGRIGEAEDIAAAVAFFCMRCSRYCTGQVLVVDGGALMKGIFQLE